ncbi:MAG TPA: hypothetical protein DCQ26_09125 [Marinilabiliales bacterium]|jgi:hypothetical protein|nr:hypothetical protein [Marinilabiliales bacterium]HAZ04800.1 hypothetical protein [Marinilabiliales bacterium]HBO75431.1 hypothetical protein [Marinilabiliales bacterium]HBX86457.1 hypothetical protein [Marinilabiliales bacterium]HBY52095.1 hypothetical protein [Marinilabiliales bacterium]
MEEMVPNKEFLVEMANTVMPFGKFKGKLLIELPEPYLVWFRQQGFPPGKLGDQLSQMYEIKLNGLEKLIWPLVKKKG